MIKKLLGIVIAALLCASLLAGCAQPAAPQGAEDRSNQGAAPADKLAEAAPAPANTSNLKFGVVLHSLNGSFFTKMKEGAEAAGRALGVEVMVSGPPTSQDLSQQVNMIENYLNSDVDGLATVLWDQDGFTKVIKAAHDKGIPFIGFNSDAPNSGRDAFIGQDLEESGYAVGKYMFENVMNGQGKYIIVSCAPTETALVLRIDGIKRANLEYPGIEMVQLVDMGTDLTKAVGIIENAYTANPDITAIIGTDVFAEAIGTFINSNGLKDKVKAGGFDLTPGTLKHISNGDMQMTCGQNPFLQGFYAVVDLYQAKQLNIKPIDIMTGMDIVDASNVATTQPE